ncbi:translocation/assembly module TamB domain-containing protein [Alteromonas facilis]|uniref:translocation/assembly module TamB domain-containing protein n=1 Tax=Alteromonas facilis TaxID=2048004 RepID=UPI000C28C5D5|nr:translocation/assembly module TamB domain-containing protein [Alteromonas facilis]
MIWFTRIVYTLVALILLTLLVAWAAVSRIGSATLVNTAADYVEGLNIGAIDGGLSSTLNLYDLHYEQAGLSVSAKHLSLDLAWHCFVQFAVCAERIDSDGLSITLVSTNEVETSPSEVKKSLIRLPLLVAIEQLNAKDSTLKLADGTVVELEGLSTELRLYRRWRFLSPQLSKLSVTLPESTQPNAPSDEQAAIVLPDIWIPLDASIDDFVLTSAQVIQGATQQGLNSLRLSAEVSGADINIQQLTLDHSMGEASVKGSIRTEGDFPLHITANARGTVDGQNIATDVTLAGSASNVDVQLSTQQPIRSNVSGSIRPLDAVLPAELSLTWDAFSNDNFAIAESFSSTGGEITISGDLSRYLVTATTEVTTAHLPSPVNLRIAGAINKKLAQISDASINTLDGNIKLSGDIQFNDSMNWVMSADITQLNLQQLNPHYPTDINGALAASGQFQEQIPNINVTSIDINAMQQGYPLSIKGSGAFAGNAGVAVSSVNIAHVDNHLQGFVRVLLDRRVDADLIVAIPKFDDTLPTVSGEMRGNIMVSGNIQEPNVDINLHAQNIVSEDESGSTTLLDKLTLMVTGPSLKPSVNLSARRPDASLDANIALNITPDLITASPNEIDFSFQNTPFSLSKRGDIRFQLPQNKATVDPLCWSSDASQICLDSLMYENNALSFAGTIPSFAIQKLLEWSPHAIPVQNQEGLLTASIKGSVLPQDGLSLTIDADISASDWIMGEEQSQITLSTEPIPLDLTLQKQQLHINSSVTGKGLGHLGITGNLDVSDLSPTIEASIVAEQFDIAPFSYLSPDIHRLSGVFNAELTLTGEAKQPNVNGILRLQQGNVDIKRAPAIINNWEAQVQFEGQQAKAKSQFSLGEGQGKALASLNWQDALSINANLTGSNLSLKHQDISLSLSPDLKFTMDNNGVSVAGEVVVPRAKIKVDSLPQGAIAESRDVHLRGEPPSTDLLDTAHIDLQLHIDPDNNNQVELDAFGLEAFLTGDLHILNQPTLSAFGDLQIIEGEYRAYGQELLIRAGDLQFNGPISQPLLYIEAIRDPQLTEDSVIAGIRIDGLASQPNVQLFSEPTLDQSQMLAYLLSGRGNINNTDASDNDYTSLLYGLGVSNSESLTSNLGNALGIDDLRLQAKGSGDNTQLTVSGKLGKDLTVEYGVGVFDSVTEVTLRYQLIPKLYLEAVSSLYESIFIYYRFSRGEVVRRSEANND